MAKTAIETHFVDTLDGKKIRAFVARPSEKPKAAVLVVQEIFGVNEHIQWVLAEQYAKAGYLAIAPSFFDRVTGFNDGAENNALAYTEADTAKGRAWVDLIAMDNPMRDLRAAKDQLAGDLPAGVVGYCWGGSVAFLSATRLGLPAVGYYGGRTAPFLHESPQAPLMLHFGETDHLIPAPTVTIIQKVLKHTAPSAQSFVYPAGHGFNRLGSKDFHEASSQLALARSLAFFGEHLK